MPEVYIAGTGSFAAEIADWTRAAGIHVSGLIELVNPDRVGKQVHDLRVVGPEEVAPGTRAVLGAGGDRRSMWERLAANGWKTIAVIHPSAVPAADAVMLDGATVGPGAVIGASTVIGEHAIVSRGALVGHHVEIGAYATVNPGANVGGNSVIGSGAVVGMGAVVVNGVSVGAGAVVAAGAVVIGDVEARSRVQGVPARVSATRPA